MEDPDDFDPVENIKEEYIEGKLFLKGHFGVFESTKKPTKFLKGFLS